MSIATQVKQAADAINQEFAPRSHSIGLILGSGLGKFAETLTDGRPLPYNDIPGFPTSAVSGHAGRLVSGVSGNAPVLVMQGRVHAYEGHDMQRIVLPVRALIAAGCSTIVITNAAGGVRNSLAPGDLVAITDHINLTGRNPLLGDNAEGLGPRFPDMSQAYDLELRRLAHRAAVQQGLTMKEGVYCWLLGPSYETPAEIRMLRTIGGDLAGMSTVPEVIAARHMGARVLGISCVTNMAAGHGATLSHDEVKETAQRVEQQFGALLTSIVQEIHAEGLQHATR